MTAHSGSSGMARPGAASAAFMAIGSQTTPLTAQTVGPSTNQSLPKSQLDKSLDSLLSKHDFCLRGDYQIPLEERSLCQLSGEAKARCPGLARACDNPFTKDEPAFELSLDWLNLPELAAVLELLLWILVVVAFALLVVFVVRRIVVARDSADDATEPPPAPVDELAPTSVALSETNVERLLARARQSAERGDYAAGMRDAYAALLYKLDQEGLIEVHRSKTNGDYRRSLSGRTDLHDEFTGIVRAVEAVQFGSQAASRDSFQAVLQRVMPLLNRSADMALLLLLVCATIACQELDKGPPASALGCGETPGGYSVFCELLAQQGSNVRRRIRKLDAIANDVGRMIVLDDAELAEEEWDVVDDWVQKGNTLVLGKLPSPVSSSLKVAHSQKRCSTSWSIAESMIGFYGEETKLATVRERALEVDAPASWVLTECDAGPTLVGTAHGEGTVFVLPSTRLLTNVSMAAGDNAYLAVNVFGHTGEVVEIIGAWTGAGSSSPFEALNNAKLTPWLLQLLIIALLLALWRGRHFGLPRDPDNAGRHAFVEHVKAMGLLYAKSKASRHTLANYGAWAVSRLHERLLPGSRGAMSDLAAALSKLTGREEKAVLEILIAAKSAQDEAHDTATPEEHLRTMRELASLLQATGGTR